MRPRLFVVLALLAASLITSSLAGHDDKGPYLVVVARKNGGHHIDGPWQTRADADGNAYLWRREGNRVLGVMTVLEFESRLTGK